MSGIYLNVKITPVHTLRNAEDIAVSQQVMTNNRPIS